MQGPQDANYIVKTLHPKALMIVDDQEAYSTGLVSAMLPVFQAAGIKVDHESVSQKVTDFSALVAKVTPGHLGGRPALADRGQRPAVRPGPGPAAQDGADLRYGRPVLAGHVHHHGSYVSSFGPDITAIPADVAIASAAKAKYGSFGTFGPPVTRPRT